MSFASMRWCLRTIYCAGLTALFDLSWLRGELSPFYSHTGCPSIDPELLIRMMLIGYCYSIRSDRRLCRAVGLDLAFRWFCRLGLEDGVPSHATFSVNRHGRFRDSDILRKVFESRGSPVYGGRPGQRRGLCRGCLGDRGRCQPLQAGRRLPRWTGRTRSGRAVRSASIWPPWMAPMPRPTPSALPRRYRPPIPAPPGRLAAATR